MMKLEFLVQYSVIGCVVFHVLLFDAKIGTVVVNKEVTAILNEYTNIYDTVEGMTVGSQKTD